MIWDSDHRRAARSDRDAVIVATARTPIGRAVKGSLASVRPDDLAAGVIEAALAKLPGFDPATLDDLYLGCAEPRDEHGGNVARRVAVQLGLDTVPAARSSGRTSRSDPLPARPIGVRAAATMTACGALTTRGPDR